MNNMSLNGNTAARAAMCVLFAALAVVFLPDAARGAETLRFWDFTQGAQGWAGNAYLKKPTVTGEGLRFTSLGIGPMMRSPAGALPGDKPLRVTVRMKTEGGDTRASLYYGGEASKEKVVRIAGASDGAWHEYSLFLPPVGPEARLWLAPFSDVGRVTVAWIRVESAAPVAPPVTRKPRRPRRVVGAKPLSVASGQLKIVHYGGSFDNFVVDVNGVEMAASDMTGRIGFVRKDGKPEWLSLERAKFRLMKKGVALEMTAALCDSEGGKWTLKRWISPGKRPGMLDITVEITADRDRAMMHVPWLTLFPGLGTYGERKTQAVFAGLEYLADEPSGSEADLRGPESVRRAPDPVKITFPLMALVNKGKYVGVIWAPSEYVAAIFDSPDRAFGSGAHLMALWAPGVGPLRRENDLYAFDSFTLSAGKPLAARMTLIGGEGESVVPAVREYVAVKGLPPVPEFGGGFQAAAEMLARGWLDSGIAADGLWRHALSGGGNFAPGRAADATALMLWLAGRTNDAALAGRLRAGAARGLERIREINPDTGQPFDPNYTSGVAHVRFPVPQLIYGRLSEYVSQYAAGGLRSAGTDFDARGVRRYVPSPGRPDFGKTHFADHANGYAASALFPALEAAWLSGDPELTRKALELLDKQTALYANSEPRGAQTWEIPLHTPDILASAYLVKCYALGYALTGRGEYLEQARYWAWTGVPFVYLYPPTGGKVGLYATIAVYGGTNWEAPVWIGLPVQWCGLVYASALYALGEYDPEGPWLRIAKGITATGLLMSYPATAGGRAGLLPDSYNLKAQVRNGPDINPGTVQAHLAELYGLGALYDLVRLPRRGWLVSAPCKIGKIKDDSRAARLSLDGWPGGAYSVLISRVETGPRAVTARPAGGKAEAESAGKTAYKYDAERKLLIIDNLSGPVEIVIE